MTDSRPRCSVYGIAGETVTAVSQRLLAHHGGLRGLFRMDIAELSRLRGPGDAKSVRLKAAPELGRRLVALSPEERPQVGSPQDIANLLQIEMAALEQEQLRVVLLDNWHRLPGDHQPIVTVTRSMQRCGASAADRDPPPRQGVAPRLDRSHAFREVIFGILKRNADQPRKSPGALLPSSLHSDLGAPGNSRAAKPGCGAATQPSPGFSRVPPLQMREPLSVTHQRRSPPTASPSTQ